VAQQSAGLLPHGLQELLAGLFAAPTGLLADPAVLVHPGMPPALIAAAPADSHAGLQQQPGDAGVALGLAAGDRLKAPVVGLAASPGSSLHKVPAASRHVSTASPVLCT
jgi:hypothetical protein